MLGSLWLGSFLAANRLSFELSKGGFLLLNTKSFLEDNDEGSAVRGIFKFKLGDLQSISELRKEVLADHTKGA